MATTNGPSAGQPVFTPINHPELRKLGRKNIHTFLRERERYLARIEDAKASGANVSALSAKSCIDPDLLLSLVEFGEFESVSSVDSLSDGVLLNWLSKKDDVQLSSLSIEDVNAAVKSSVRMNTNEPDPELRIMSLFMDYRTFLRSRKWDIISTNPKLAISHICELLKPHALKFKVENDLELGHKSLRKDWAKFYKHVIDRAIACEEFAPLKPEARKEAKSNGIMASTSVGRQKSPVAQPVVSKESSTRRPSTRVQKESSAFEKQLPKCLNPKCDKRELIKNCAISTEAEKVEFLRKYREEKKAAEIRKAKVSAIHSEPKTSTANLAPGVGSGRFKAKLADVINVVVNGDYGADHSALSSDHLQQCADAGVFVQVLPLREPVTVGLALNIDDDGEKRTFNARSKARISTTLFVEEGSFRLRNIEYLVFDEPMDEILIGRPVLRATGFDLDKHFAAVRSNFHDKDFSHIGFFDPTESEVGIVPPANPGRLSRLMLSADTQKEQSKSLDDDETPADVPILYEETDDNPVLPLTNNSVAENTLPESVSPLFYGDFADDDPIPTDLDLEPGEDDVAITKACLETMIEDAIGNGLPDELHEDLRNLVWSYTDIFRTKMGADPPASLPPMKIRLKQDAKPVSVRVRKYSPPQAAFLRKKVDDLLRLGLIRPNNSIQWACAPLIVPKAGPEQYRFTVDLRPVNSQTVPHIWPMPNLESVTAELVGDTCYASIDLCHGYWQLGLDEESQECQSFITPDGVFTPTRVLHGQTNATSYFQSTIQQLCIPIRDYILQWLDDLLFHCKTGKDLLEILGKFFEICRTAGLKLHAKKCKLFLVVVKWCGRIINKDGIRLDPTRLDALLRMPAPTTGADLQQFVCASNWMRSTIPDYARTVSPLLTALEKVYGKASRRTKSAVAKVLLTSAEFGDVELRAFEKLKQCLHNSASLAHPDPKKVLCLFTDASDESWSGILTQIPQTDIDLDFSEQNHEPLSFLSGHFKGSSSRWSTAEKEAFAIVQSVIRLDFILLRPDGFFMFTDHKNLVYLFNPHATNPQISKHVAGKIERWSLKLSQFRYTVMHIPGELNSWADLLSRWGASDDNQQDESQKTRRMSISSLFAAPLCPDLDPDFKWPSAKDISDAQAAALERGDESLPDGFTHQYNGRSLRSENRIYKNENSVVWIPAAAVHLQFRLCVIGHCGRAGHRGVTTTHDSIKAHFTWTGMRSDIASFCNSCLHCMATIGGQRIPRVMGHAMHSDTPNELLHFDFLYTHQSSTKHVYTLIIKDNASSFVWLVPCEHADAETTAQALLSWFASFGVATTWVSDRGSHFKNTLMTLLNRKLHAHHHYTTPYCPQANGTVESVCREVLRACRALLSEFRMAENEWPLILPLLQSTLNHSVRESLGGRAPITAFTGLPADNPLRTLLPSSSAVPQTIEFVKAQRIIKMDLLEAALTDIHKDVSKVKTRRRQDAVKRHNAKTQVQPANFDKGDFVLVAQRISKDGHKLRVKWKGPRRVTRAASEFIFEVQDLVTLKHALVHANRLKFYADSQLDVTENLLDSAAHNDPHFQTIEKLLDLRFNTASELHEVKTQWKGFEHEDPTWEPISAMHEDVPSLLSAFLKKHPNKSMARKAKNSLQTVMVTSLKERTTARIHKYDGPGLFRSPRINSHAKIYASETLQSGTLALPGAFNNCCPDAPSWVATSSAPIVGLYR